MLFSQTAEYALRAVVWLAGHPTESQTTRQIADGTRVPAGYLSKVLQSLVRAGLVESQRGIGGGFTALPAEDMTVLDVINAVDPIQRIVSCPLGLEIHGDALCPLHAKLDDTLAMIEEAFRSTTVADVLKGPRKKTRLLCDISREGKKLHQAK